jgi:hypothetical protein
VVFADRQRGRETQRVPATATEKRPALISQKIMEPRALTNI